MFILNLASDSLKGYLHHSKLAPWLTYAKCFLWEGYHFSSRKHIYMQWVTTIWMYVPKKSHFLWFHCPRRSNHRHTDLGTTGHTCLIALGIFLIHHLLKLNSQTNVAIPQRMFQPNSSTGLFNTFLVQVSPWSHDQTIFDLTNTRLLSSSNEQTDIIARFQPVNWPFMKRDLA